MNVIQSKASFTICVLFMLGLTVPLVEWWVSEDQAISIAEKRQLAQRPSWSANDKSKNEYISEFEVYFNDQFGFRDKLVYFHNLLKYKFFGVSSTNWVIPGKQDWLFFNDGGNYKEYFPAFLFNEDYLEQVTQLLETRRDWLETLGGYYLMVPIPNKADVYDELLPHRIKKYKSQSRYDQIIDYLVANDRFRDFIDSKKILLSAKNQTQVYLSTDTHWSEDGFKAVYEQIIEHLIPYFPGIEPLEIRSDREKPRAIFGDLAAMMNLQSVFPETTSSLIWSKRCKIKEEKVYQQITEFNEFIALSPDEYPVISGCPDKNTKAIVIHDSFGILLRPLLSQHFGTVIYSNYMEFNDLINMIEFEKPDVVLDLRIARNFQSLFEYSENLEDRMLHLKQATLTDLKMEINAQTLDAHLEASYNVEIKPAEQGLHLHAPTHSPRLNFIFDAGDERSPLVVKIKLKSEHEASMVLYYSSIGDRQYATNKSLTRTLTKGENNIMLRIPTANAQGKMAFIPGYPAGDYELLEFKVYRQ